MIDPVKQVRGEVRNFLDDTIQITSIPGANNKSYDFDFSQRENIALIDFYYNSKFKTGKTDSNGNLKIFINEGKFRCDVAEMQIDIDISNYLFVPTTQDYWTPWFMSRDFHNYVRENDYGEVVNDWGADLPRYGTAVSKKVGKEVKRVPLNRLMNTQNASSLLDAAKSGGYVIEQMELTKMQMEEYPDWNLSKLPEAKDDGTYVVYERYGLITDATIALAKGEETKDVDAENHYLGMIVVCTDMEQKDGGILFAEKIEEDDFPYNEVHWARQDGRWQGIGVMEEQFQNQLARNLSTHYRMKSMMWAGKRLFGKNTTEGPNNLHTEATDGAVIDFGVGGQAYAINTQSQHLADFQQFDNILSGNADQTSFTYEGASGDSPKAGTPYSLQVLVDNTLQKHFGKKKERFGAFLRRVYFDQMVDIFMADRRKEHTMSFPQTEEGVDLLREAMIDIKTNDKWMEVRFDEKPVSREMIRQEVEEELIKSPYLVVTIDKNAYKNAKYISDIILTGERRNIFAEMETVKTLLADARAEGNIEEANKLKRELISLTGRMPVSMTPKIQQAPQAQAPEAPELPNPVNP